MVTKESYNLEFKREISRGFLKTVSAFANYNDGEVIFGLNDDGSLMGIEGDTQQECLRIENMINDSFSPVPYFEINDRAIEGRVIIVLTVKKGKDTPYYCGGKAYKRSDTATVEVSRFELRRLAMEGINTHFEDQKASSQNLTFSTLESWLVKEAGIEKIGQDVLKTLNLYHRDGYYNIAGALLSDQSGINFSGIDIVKFGRDTSKILYRKTVNDVSLLEQLDTAIAIFEQYYTYEEIDGYTRIKREMVPKEAFREALANAIVHRIWDVNSFIQIAMYEEWIEINSPGGLPAGISEEEYFYGNISVLRNPIIASVFNRLNIIEKFGTGIARINHAYLHSETKPSFSISENRIVIKLPITDFGQKDLSEDEAIVFKLLKDGVELSRKAIDQKTGFDKSKTIRILNNLVEKDRLLKFGSGPSVMYRLK